MGSGKPLRQFIFSWDLARLFIWVLREYHSVSPIILSVPEADEISIKQVAECIKNAVGYEGEITWNPTGADGQFKKTASNSKLMELHSNFSFTPFNTALELSVKWFIDNYETARK
jgi:GDP-L-fucose synthase